MPKGAAIPQIPTQKRRTPAAAPTGATTGNPHCSRQLDCDSHADVFIASLTVVADATNSVNQTMTMNLTPLVNQTPEAIFIDKITSKHPLIFAGFDAICSNTTLLWL